MDAYQELPTEYDLRTPREAPTIRALEQVAHYQDLKFLGRGGMAVILRGWDPQAEREVAIKLLPVDSAHQAELMRRFMQEGRLTAQLEHPNIVPVHEVGRVGKDAIYFTMKLVRGVSLTQHLAQSQAGADRRALLRIFLKITDAVAYAHSSRVIHRDLKPANIMIGQFGEVLVMDWGLAKRVGTPGQHSGREIEDDADPSRTMEGMVLGTPHYMSPEQAKGELSLIDERSDIFSLGVILYELLTGLRPFEGDTTRAVLDDLLSGKPRPARATPAGRSIPRELSAIVSRAMAFEPDARYSNATSLRADVQAYLDGRMLSAAHYNPLQRMAKRISARPGLSWAGVAALLITTLGLHLYGTYTLSRITKADTRGGLLGVSLDGRRPENPVIIKRILPGLAAEQAGLQRGDQILWLGNTKTPTYRRFCDAISLQQPGSEQKITILRKSADGSTRSKTLTLRLGTWGSR